MDEVDEVMAAWHRERPDLATSPMAVWSRIHRLAGLLDAARKRCFAEHGLDNWEFDVLAALRRAGMSQSEVARALGLTPQGLSQFVKEDGAGL